MTYELYPDTYGHLWAILEVTYGTTPSIAATDAIYVESATASYDRDTIRRAGMAPGRQGRKSYPGRVHVPWDLETDVQLRVIADPPVAGNVPPIDPILQGCGFQRVLGGAGQTSIGYFLRSFAFGSWSFYDHMTNEAGDDETRIIGRGARGSARFSLGGDGRLMVGASGFALPQATLANTRAATGAGPGAVTYADLAPLIYQGARTRIHRHTGNAVFGGGGLSGPTNSAALLDFTVDCAMNPTEELGGHAAGGVARIALRPTEPVQITFTVEMTDESEWSWHTIRDGDTLAFDVRPVAAGVAARTCQMLANGQVVDVAQGGDGRRTMQVTMEARWPEDASDAAPAVGTDPASVFTAGTNEGLDEVPSGATPVASVFALLFDAAS